MDRKNLEELRKIWGLSQGLTQGSMGSRRRFGDGAKALSGDSFARVRGSRNPLNLIRDPAVGGVGIGVAEGKFEGLGAVSEEVLLVVG